MSKILVPDYFETFQCKCGSCRHPCCDGWGINIAEREYFTLIGLACSTRLRHKLDDAFVISDQATEASFAHIQPNYLEQCPMLDDDGLCLLQKEQGEAILPLICRLYPRAVKRYGDHHEICMSCSCEETVEVLMQTDAPLTLHETDVELPFDGLTVYGDEPEKDAMRAAVIELMSRTEQPIGERIAAIGRAVCGAPMPPAGSRAGAIRAALGQMNRFCRGSKSMRLCAEPVTAYFGDPDEKTDEELTDLFDRAEAHLYEVIPALETHAGRIIANHLLYESFPYTPESGTPDAAFAAFSCAVGLLKVLCVGGMVGHNDRDSFTDILAFANRFIEHSEYYRLCAALSHPSGAETYATFAALFTRAN